jgi:sec-independent protein translocase protein TatB
MFDLGWSELLLVAVVALVVIGPKDLPVAMRQLGKWVGKARAMTRHVRAGFDEMVRQSELEEMEKEWRAHNAAIMAATPTAAAMDAPPPLDPQPETAHDHAGEPPATGLEALGLPNPQAQPEPDPAPETSAADPGRAERAP